MDWTFVLSTFFVVLYSPILAVQLPLLALIVVFARSATHKTLSRIGQVAPKWCDEKSRGTPKRLSGSRSFHAKVPDRVVDAFQLPFGSI